MELSSLHGAMTFNEGYHVHVPPLAATLPEYIVLLRCYIYVQDVYIFCSDSREMFVPASSFHGSMRSNGGRAVSCTCREVNNIIIVCFFLG